MKSEIRTSNVYSTAGPYCQGVEAKGGKLVVTSGFLARDVTGKIVGKSDMVVQSKQCLENIRLAIEAAGGGLRDVIRLNVILTHPKNYEAMNAVRKEVFGGIDFTSVTIVAQLIDPDALVEMDAIAVVDDPVSP